MATFNIGIVITATNAAGRHLQNLQQQMERLHQASMRTNRALSAFQVVLGAVAAGTVVNAAKNFAKVGSEMEQLRIRLAVFEGGVEGADKRMQSLMKNFGHLPFEFSEVTAAFTRLKAAGIEDTERALKSMLDALSAFGGGTDELQRLSIGIQQVAGKGVLSMEELRQQIGEAVPFAMRIMAEETGRSVAQLISDVSKGAVDSKEAIDALVNGFEERFGGLADILGRTMLGAMNRIRTAVNEAADHIFNDLGLGARITILLETIADRISKFAASITQADVEDFWQDLRNIAVAAEGVVNAIVKIATVVWELGSAIGGLLGSFGTEIATYGVIGYMMFGVKGAALMIAGGALYNIFLHVQEWMQTADAQTKATLSTLGAAAGFGLIGFLFMGPAGAALVAMTAFVLDTIATQVRDWTVDLLKMGGADGAAGFVERAFGKEGQSVGARFFEEAAEMVREFTSSDSIAADAFEQSSQKWKQLLFDRALAMQEFKKWTDEADISQTAISAIESLTKLGDQIDKKIAGTEGLPFMQQLEGYYQQIEQFDKQIAAETKRYQRELADARSQGPLVTDFGQGMTELENFKKSLGSMSAQAAAARAKVAELRQEMVRQFVEENITEKIDDVTDKLAKMGEALGGNELQARIADVNNKYGDIRRTVDDIEDNVRKLITSEGDQYLPLLEVIETVKASINQQEQKAVDLAKQRYEIENQIFQLQQQAERNSIADKMADMQREFGGLQFGNSYVDKARDAHRQFRDELNSTAQQIKQIQIELSAPDLDPLRKAELEQTLVLLDQYRAKIQEVSATVTAESILVRETWTELGGILKDGIVDSLTAIVTKSESLKDVMTNTFNAITKAAIEYLTQLMLIKAAGGLSAAGAPGAAGFLGFLGGFANGGAFKGGIKAFANGGLIQGPTMFGLAGEKGTEAIMPLERVGGKLGVRSVGGGDSITINLHAIDTKSGTEFLLQNMDTIAGGLNQKRKLNRGLDRNR